MEAAVSYLLMLQKLCQFGAKNSETNYDTLCLASFSKNPTNNNMK